MNVSAAIYAATEFDTNLWINHSQHFEDITAKYSELVQENSTSGRGIGELTHIAFPRIYKADIWSLRDKEHEKPEVKSVDNQEYLAEAVVKHDQMVYIKIARKWAYKVKGVPQDKALVFAAAENFHGRTVRISIPRKSS